MAQKEAPQFEAWAVNDSSSLELEIDKEIDSLFVPAVLSPDADETSVAGLRLGGSMPPDTPPQLPHPDDLEIRAGEETLMAQNEHDNFEMEHDAGALELEIDKGIDSLFVPAVRNPDADDVDAAAIRADDEKTGNVPPKLDVANDTSALELEINKEIDALFVPAPRGNDGKAASGAAPVHNPTPPKDSPSQSRQPASDLNSIEVEIEREIDKLFVPSPHSDSSPASVEQTDPSAELSALIEQFNAAYLSLDWDFTKENLQKFIVALQRLEPIASRSMDAKSVYRIIEVILKRLLDKPRAINTKLVQVIRDSQGLLAHLLLLDGASGPQEKQRLKELVEMFQDLRRKAIAAKTANSSPESFGANQGTAVPSSASSPSPLPGDVSPQVLSQTPHSGAGDNAPLQAEIQAVAQTAVSAPESLPKAETAQPGVHHEDSCLLVSDGKLLALPEACVVKVARATSRMCSKILKRGYATLTDFKPPLRSAKNGVFDQWAQLEAKELQSYRFEPSPFDSEAGGIAAGPIAVLASNGQTHRIFFCDTFSYISNAEIAFQSRPEVDPSPNIELRVKVALIAMSNPGSALPCPVNTQN
jgi:hypothetical protein